MPSFSSLVFAVALAVSSPFAFAESNSNLRPETDSGGFIHPAESLNIFGLPKGVKVAADAAEGGRKLQTIATGWLYASSNGGNTDCSTVNTVVGTLTNTCLVSGLDTTNNDQNSILYTCDSGHGYKRVYSGTTCNPNNILKIEKYELGTCITYNTQKLTVNCAKVANIQLPPTGNWVTTEYFEHGTCSDPMIEYTSLLNNTCVPTLNPYTKLPNSYYYKYPTGLYYNTSSTCTGPSMKTPPVNTCTNVPATSRSADILYIAQVASMYTTIYPPVGDNTPTAPPTTMDVSIKYNTLQILSGINATGFRANFDANFATLTSAVASSMSGVDAANIEFVNVHNPLMGGMPNAMKMNQIQAESQGKTLSFPALDAAHTPAASAQQVHTEAATACGVYYIVKIPSIVDAGYTSGEQAYLQTTSQLDDAMDQGTFDSYLQNDAVVFAAPQMVKVISPGASYSTYVTGPANPTSSSTNDDSGLSANQVSGIVAGSVLGFGVLLGLLIGIKTCLGGGAGASSAGGEAASSSTTAGVARTPSNISYPHDGGEHIESGNPMQSAK